jgi:hypothetical protein
MDQDQDWEHQYNIAEKSRHKLWEAIGILTFNHQARLNWLHRLGDLHLRIPEHVRQEIGDIIDEAYEQWQKECDEGRNTEHLIEN